MSFYSKPSIPLFGRVYQQTFNKTKAYDTQDCIFEPSAPGQHPKYVYRVSGEDLDCLTAFRSRLFQLPVTDITDRDNMASMKVFLGFLQALRLKAIKQS